MRRLFITYLLVLVSGVVHAVGPFEGHWLYAQPCGWQHGAELRLLQTGSVVKGSWSDGHRVKVWGGELQGNVRGGKLFIRFCSDGAWGDESHVCPELGSESAYFVRQGEALVWYTKKEEAFGEYVTLHRIAKGKHLPKDNKCPNEE